MRPSVPEGGSRTCCWSWVPWLETLTTYRVGRLGLIVCLFWRNSALYGDFGGKFSVSRNNNSGQAWRWCDLSSLKMRGSADWRECWEKVSSVLRLRPPPPPPPSPPPRPRTPPWRTRRGWRAASSLPQRAPRGGQRPGEKQWGSPEYKQNSTLSTWTGGFTSLSTMILGQFNKLAGEAISWLWALGSCWGYKCGNISTWSLLCFTLYHSNRPTAKL